MENDTQYEYLYIYMQHAASERGGGFTHTNYHRSVLAYILPSDATGYTARDYFNSAEINIFKIRRA